MDKKSPKQQNDPKREDPTKSREIQQAQQRCKKLNSPSASPAHPSNPIFPNHETSRNNTTTNEAQWTRKKEENSSTRRTDTHSHLSILRILIRRHPNRSLYHALYIAFFGVHLHEAEPGFRGVSVGSREREIARGGEREGEERKEIVR
jgi:outer membrane biosynthesis protein TonB